MFLTKEKAREEVERQLTLHLGERLEEGIHTWRYFVFVIKAFDDSLVATIKMDKRTRRIYRS